MLSEKEREQIYTEEKIIYGNTIEWRFKDGSLKLKVPVLRPNGEELTLFGVYGRRGQISFSLNYRKTVLIRRFDHRIHTNPDGRKILGPHKHKWTESHGDNIAYEVNDIPVERLDDALQAFLKECNITVEGPYQMVIL